MMCRNDMECGRVTALRSIGIHVNGDFAQPRQRVVQRVADFLGNGMTFNGWGLAVYLDVQLAPQRMADPAQPNIVYAAHALHVAGCMSHLLH